MKKWMLFFLIAFFSFATCKEKTERTCDPDVDRLHTLLSFPCGVAIDTRELRNNPIYRNLAARQFNNITAENIFKPAFLHPEEGSFFWEKAEELVAFAEDHQQGIHGHTLLWHNQLPAWMEQFQGSPAAWDTMMKKHIQTIVGYFKGSVKSWDVLNEGFTDEGLLRNNIWKQNIGSSYLEKAFRYAHEADPEALLFYNDYFLEYDEDKREAVLKTLKDLKQRGVPIHGIGMQMHISISFPENEQIAAALFQAAKSGFQIHLSEIDIAINSYNREMPQAEESLLQRQADKLLFIIKTYRQIPKQQQFGITFWGLSDADTWIRSYFNRQDYPLLFDDQYQPKPVYCKLLEQL